MTKRKQVSEKVEHYTPPEFATAILGVLGRVDTDPATSSAARIINAQHAETIYTEADDGLSKHWHGRVFLNPPYGKQGNRSNTDIWFSKLIDEYRIGRVSEAIFLCNVATGAEWFKKVWAFDVCFVYRRIAFIDIHGVRQTQPMYDNMFIYLGSEFEDFTRYFQEMTYAAFPSGIGRVFKGESLALLNNDRQIGLLS